MLLIIAGLAILWLLIVAAILAVLISLDIPVTYPSRHTLP
jgi:hypothetical protein